ncbi:MAG: ParA family protein [Anaerolineales bacterium]|nr:ParA family protein [Anaerolineales bacterium]
MTIVYALVNQKGGVGKTTTAISLGAYLAQAGKRVLLVDIDAQANATACLGIDHRTMQTGTYDLLLGEKQAGEVTLRSPQLNLSLIPSSPALAGAQVELIDLEGRESLLLRGLRTVDGKYDYILIDCPPSLGLLTLNGLIAATHGVIIPVQCEYLALEGLGQLMHTLKRIQSGLKPSLIVRGMLLTMFDSRTNLSQDVVDEVSQHFPNKVFQTIIPRSVRLAEAPSFGVPISVYAPSSSGGRAYSELADELLKNDQRITSARGTI